MVEVKRDIQKLLDQHVVVDKQPKALFDADFVGAMS